MSAKTPDYPCNFVIFGATGNLSVLKLIPALYHLEVAQRLPDALTFIAFARREWGQDEWRAFMEQALRDKLKERYKDEIFGRFVARFS